MRHHGRRITRIHHRSGMCRPSRKGLLPMIEIRDPRLTTRMRTPAAAAAMLSVCVAATACSMEETALRQITPNAVVYIDGWDQDGDRGDRALVEQKPSGMWVLPAYAPFRDRSGGGFTVRVTLDPKRGFVV